MFVPVCMPMCPMPMCPPNHAGGIANSVDTDLTAPK